MAAAEGDHVIDVDALTRKIDGKLSSPMFLSPLRSIFRIPTIHSRHNQNAYTPNAFSFGPYHHDKESLKPTEKIKAKYLHDLIFRLSPPNDPNPAQTRTLVIKKFIEAIIDKSEEARWYYAGPIGMEEDKFVEILVFDGCFIIELFRKNSYKDLIEENDPIFTMSLLQFLWHDLILLENQIPWMVLEYLFHKSLTCIDRKPLSLLAIEFFGSLFSTAPPRPGAHLFGDNIKHILNLLREYLVSSSTGDRNSDPGWEPIPSASSLEESGIRFKMSERSTSILDVKFHKKEGIIEIPSLLIHENTDTLLRNLICLELYSPKYDCIITSYAMLFDNLIQTTTDMKVLCESGVISNRLHLEDATKIFNHPYEVYASVKENYYRALIRDVDQYRRGRKDYYIRRWKVYRRELKRVYFSHPWAAISTVAASVILILTFLQTLFTYMYR